MIDIPRLTHDRQHQPHVQQINHTLLPPIAGAQQDSAHARADTSATMLASSLCVAVFVAAMHKLTHALIDTATGCSTCCTCTLPPPPCSPAACALPCSSAGDRGVRHAVPSPLAHPPRRRHAQAHPRAHPHCHRLLYLLYLYVAAATMLASSSSNDE